MIPRLFCRFLLIHKRFTKLKDRNPALKPCWQVGGWNVVRTLVRKCYYATVTCSVHSECHHPSKKWSFDGLDVDWANTPPTGAVPRNSASRATFVTLTGDARGVRALKVLCQDRPRLLLTAAVAAGKSTIDTAYEITSVITVSVT
ncbi:hypothetical protein C0Q70_02167 [Pomacea canaliculata]|uniref:GH18 domain-containing protein n=1 Tax=Pomacea canaliculata TaxID=400727 RepID=A0A2T7Q1J9_POMCA|nr:hypothetical protein C0Q70_02167 [Pomacea canaliculata]